MKTWHWLAIGAVVLVWLGRDKAEKFFIPPSRSIFVDDGGLGGVKLAGDRRFG